MKRALASDAITPAESGLGQNSPIPVTVWNVLILPKAQDVSAKNGKSAEATSRQKQRLLLKKPRRVSAVTTVPTKPFVGTHADGARCRNVGSQLPLFFNLWRLNMSQSAIGWKKTFWVVGACLLLAGVIGTPNVSVAAPVDAKAATKPAEAPKADAANAAKEATSSTQATPTTGALKADSQNNAGDQRTAQAAPGPTSKSDDQASNPVASPDATKK
jgi:hypothetical protein